MMVVSALCALSIGFFLDGPLWCLLAVALVWGFSVIGDSAQFATLVTELADQAYVGTALTIQLAFGFTLSVATIWLIPIVDHSFGWHWAFAFLVPGPVIGALAMIRLATDETDSPRGVVSARRSFKRRLLEVMVAGSAARLETTVQIRDQISNGLDSD